MLIERVTLLPPDTTDDSAPISPSAVTLRSADRSRQLAVLEVPARALEETPLAAHPDREAGYGIVLTTTEERTYSGYIEVVVEGTDSRFYWCAFDFDFCD